MSFIIKQQRKLIIQYIFVVFTLWIINIFMPYLSGLYIDHLVSGMVCHCDCSNEFHTDVIPLFTGCCFYEVKLQNGVSI